MWVGSLVVSQAHSSYNFAYARCHCQYNAWIGNNESCVTLNHTHSHGLLHRCRSVMGYSVFSNRLSSWVIRFTNNQLRILMTYPRDPCFVYGEQRGAVSVPGRTLSYPTLLTLSCPILSCHVMRSWLSSSFLDLGGWSEKSVKNGPDSLLRMPACVVSWTGIRKWIT